MLPDLGQAGGKLRIKIPVGSRPRPVADKIRWHTLNMQTLGETLVGGNRLLDALAMHVGLKLCRVEAKLRGDE